ncbi:MAG: hypothetical protein AB7P50_18585 [Alphaproteobacteria bacterium]
MDMGRMNRPDNEFLKPLLDRIFGPEPYAAPSRQTARDFTGHTIIYSIFTLPAGIALIWLGHAGWFLLPVGVLVAGAYWLGWGLMPPRDGIDRPTIFGEYASGAIIYGALALA